MKISVLLKTFLVLMSLGFSATPAVAGLIKYTYARGDLDWKSTFIAGQNNWERNTFLHFTSGKLILNQDSDFDTRLNHMPAYLKRFFNNKKIPKVFDISRLSTVKVIPN
jgi:hypothetical protein